MKEYNHTGIMIQPCNKGPQLPKRPTTTSSKLELWKLQCTTSQSTPKPKENFTCCHTRHLGRTECPENPQLPSILFWKARRKGLFQGKHMRVPCHKSEERERNIVRCYGKKCKMGVISYGSWAELTERLIGETPFCSEHYASITTKLRTSTDFYNIC